jgi:transcriptional regulator with PAS, ATPase and Fis domain
VLALVKAALLSLEENILEILKELKEYNKIEFILQKVIEAPGAVAAAREAEDCGADVIFAYGLQSLIDNRTIRIPIVNIMLSGHDVGILLKEAKEQLKPARPEVGLLVYSCMVRRSSSLSDLLGVGLKAYMLDEFEDHESAVERAVGDGVNIIVGVHDAKLYAEKRGISTIGIFSGKEGLTHALRSIEALSQAIETDKNSAAENAAFINSIFHGIIEVNKNGDILKINDYAKNLLDCKNKDITGQSLLKFFPRTIKDSLDTVLLTGQPIYKPDSKLMNRQVLTNIEPIISSNEIIGAVITLQRGQFVQITAPESQNEAYSRGFKSTHRFRDVKTKSECYENLIKQAHNAASCNAPVLISGEEGTESLRMAQCIHHDSARRLSGFVEVDCGAWETAHLNDMLFGSKNYPGEELGARTLIELADGGTLFLNHIEALTNELQFKICRLIRGDLLLPDNRIVSANVRVIAATRSNLETLMSEGGFRSDLYYALNIYTLDIPPLRERKEDLEAWIDYFFEYYCNLYSRPIQLSRGACRCMCEYPWPGNIRQLENFCHKILLLTPHRNIDEAFVRNNINKLGNAGYEHTAEKVQQEDAVKVLEALKKPRRILV